MNAIKPEPLDVWLLILEEGDEDELTHAEANTYKVESGFCVEWYLNSVGLVSKVWFPTLEAAHEWLRGEGYQDFSCPDEGDPEFIEFPCGFTSWETPDRQCWGCVANECHGDPCCNCECHYNDEEI